ncbi:hypothetical protein [Bacillus mycoides]|uniref:hypothetical protein n=1 Tax=Bacillus mycoides TaxID=1405 RepID=UPI003A7FE065
MKISEESLRKQVTAYIKDGVLVKWEFEDREDVRFYARMNEKYRNREPLADEDIRYLKQLGNVVIEQEKTLEFVRFTGIILKG